MIIERSPKYNVYLGGTYNGSTWRSTIIDELNLKDENIKCFDPTILTDPIECVELTQCIRSMTKNHLYVITPKSFTATNDSDFSMICAELAIIIAEAMESATNSTKNLIFTILTKDDTDVLSEETINRLLSLSNILASYGATRIIADDLDSTINALYKNICDSYETYR